MYSYNLIYSKRKTLALQIGENGELIVRAPKGISRKTVESEISKHREWIDKARVRVKNKEAKYNNADIEELKQKARIYIPSRVAFYAPVIGVHPEQVKINSAKKRFGSCSGKNSINFSCYLMLYPNESIDYVVVHELCHILHHDHSAAFYREIEKILPDYREREEMLKQ